ncbi:hypothetical protein [Candidatus Kuenenia sp.]|uniref:hypothetical protein n=1 Tax=Candidatus Kuenenia sp. TaxID=2499824 RepID=UPI00321F67BE
MSKTKAPVSNICKNIFSNESVPVPMVIENNFFRLSLYGKTTWEWDGVRPFLCGDIKAKTVKMQNEKYKLQREKADT